VNNCIKEKMKELLESAFSKRRVSIFFKFLKLFDLTNKIVRKLW